MTNPSLLETCGLSVPPHFLPGPRSSPCFADALYKEDTVSFQDALWCPQSFLERIAFAKPALWGDACAAPDSGMTLFIALFPEPCADTEVRASSRHLAPGCLSTGDNWRDPSPCAVLAAPVLAAPALAAV